MSIELNDENIGEASHNMHDGLFKSLVPVSHLNPLVSNQKDSCGNDRLIDSSRLCNPQVSARDKEIIQDHQPEAHSSLLIDNSNIASAKYYSNFIIFTIKIYEKSQIYTIF